MLVFSLVLVSTRLTMTAQYMLYFPSAEGRLPDITTHPPGAGLIGGNVWQSAFG